MKIPKLSNKIYEGTKFHIEIVGLLYTFYNITDCNVRIIDKWNELFIGPKYKNHCAWSMYLTGEAN